jgi:L-asparagine oxygenase
VTITAPLADQRVWTIEPEFVFTELERDSLHDALGATTVSPYRSYVAFDRQVTELIRRRAVPRRFVDHVASLAGRDRAARPVVVIKNGPYDRDVPVFDFTDPVRSKYHLKTTFVAEAMLAVLAQLAGTPAIAYVDVNDGDVFQDIYPQESLAGTQSQKALEEVRFHQDFANHVVPPDQIHMVGMRSHRANEVYTSFVRTIDLWPRFGADELDVLRSRLFCTPFDDLSAGPAVDDAHAVLGGDGAVRYFEGRTRGLTRHAELVLARLDEALHALKQRVFIDPGDLVVTYNRFTLHAKEVVRVVDEDALRTRWIMKTVNVDSIAPHLRHLVPGTDHLVDG